MNKASFTMSHSYDIVVELEIVDRMQIKRTCFLRIKSVILEGKIE